MMKNTGHPLSQRPAMALLEAGAGCNESDDAFMQEKVRDGAALDVAGLVLPAYADCELD
jgi:hypothetical protein